MKNILAIALTALFLVGCNKSTENSGAYSKNGGGSFEGMGGAGPGYDGSGSGGGKHGTVPESGAVKQGETGNTQTNSAIPAPDATPQKRTHSD